MHTHQSSRIVIWLYSLLWFHVPGSRGQASRFPHTLVSLPRKAKKVGFMYQMFVCTGHQGRTTRYARVCDSVFLRQISVCSWCTTWRLHYFHCGPLAHRLNSSLLHYTLSLTCAWALKYLHPFGLALPLWSVRSLHCRVQYLVQKQTHEIVALNYYEYWFCHQARVLSWYYITTNFQPKFPTRDHRHLYQQSLLLLSLLVIQL